MSLLNVQKRLKELGLDPGPLDGLYGPSTERAINSALDKLSPTPGPSLPIPGVVPELWLPWARMERIIQHWTAGAYKANKTDLANYHILIEGDANLVRGNHSIKDNEAPITGGYAAHTLNLNSGSIGVSLCCMAGATEVPFNAGNYPMTRVQWDQLVKVTAQVAERYGIPVTRSTILSHAEVQQTLGIKQRQKWDYTRLAFDPSIKGALAIGDRMRAEVKALL